MNDESENNYYIVSNDNGYSVLLDYWKKKGINIILVKNLKAESVNTKTESVNTKIISTPKNGELETILKTLIKNDEDISETIKIVNDSKTKVEVNNNLCKKFNSEKGGKIYRAIKSLIADKKSN